MKFSLLKRPSGFIPIAMSIAALGIVIVYAAMFGGNRCASVAVIDGRTVATCRLLCD